MMKPYPNSHSSGEKEKVKVLLDEMEVPQQPLKLKKRGFSLYKIFLFLAAVSGVAYILYEIRTHYCSTNNSNANSNDKRSGSYSIDLTRDTFLKDGVPFRYISGSIHYSRVPPDYWRDRLLKAKAMGVDTIQTYVPWNFHEFEEGEFNFSGDRDLVAFIETVKSLDLLLILRAGPYICGEWDFGGFPAWLLRKDPKMKLRSSDPGYLSAVKNWWNVLLPKVRPYLYSSGGPIIMVQIENEYGSYYTCDAPYLRFLHDLARQNLGDDVVLFSTDGNSLGYLKCGALDLRTYPTVDFGTGTAENPKDAFADLRKVQPHGPLVNSEYYTGWLDNWGNKHNRVPTVPIVKGMKAMLDYNASVNMYMLHGGTTFGYWNGVNNPPFSPSTTSYDYDAPISEAGDVGEKYMALRALFATYKNGSLPDVPGNTTKTAYGVVRLAERSNVLSALNTPHREVTSDYPLTMEAAKQYQGFMGYMTDIQRPPGDLLTVKLDRVGDVAYVFSADSTYHWVNFLGKIDNRTRKDTYFVSPMHTKLILLVDNMGHINYGSSMFNDVKGIVGNVTVNGNILKGWTMIAFNLSLVPVYPLYPEVVFPPQASVHLGHLNIDGEPTDTFIKMTNFSKGHVHINGFNIGRYWTSRGPQQTLFVPKSYLRQGSANLVQVFEWEEFKCPRSDMCYVEFTDSPVLDGPVHRLKGEEPVPGRFFTQPGGGRV